jgi:hypothetical protein
LLCLALAACNRQPEQPLTGAPIAALPLADAAPPPASYAPPASALPPPPRPMAYRPAPEHYRYLTDAYAMADAFGDTPPDYTVDYDDEYPWVWRADDGGYRVVEWVPSGARYYYYEPGADAPFLIEDPNYAYAYERGVLVGVYTLYGAPVADRLAAARTYDAARYYSRAGALYRAAIHDQRRAAYAAQWRERAPIIVAQRERWARARTEQPQWRDWDRANRTRETQRWAPERQRRLAYAKALRERGGTEPTAPQRPIAQPVREPEPRSSPQAPVHPIHVGRDEHRPAAITPRVEPRPMQPTERTRPIQRHEPERKPPTARTDRDREPATRAPHTTPRSATMPKAIPAERPPHARPQQSHPAPAARPAPKAIERPQHFARPERGEPRRPESRPAMPRPVVHASPPTPRAQPHIQAPHAPAQHAQPPRPAPHAAAPAGKDRPQRGDRRHE